MKLLGQILLACILFTVLQALVAAFVVALMLLLIWGLLFRTRETVGLLVVFAFLNALTAHPWAAIGVVGLLLGGLWIAEHLCTRASAHVRPVAQLPSPADQTSEEQNSR